MPENRAGRSSFLRGGSIYESGAIQRSIIIWFGFQMMLWVVFAISYFTHKEAWQNTQVIVTYTATFRGWWSTFFYILLNNLFICTLIAAGNIFVRFNIITPGLLILLIQAVMIGWLAGSNGFEFPFENVRAANLQYLQIGLWETTAYALVCSVTVTKSLLVSDTFPPQKWSLVRKFKDIKPCVTETVLLSLAAVCLIVAAVIETFKLVIS